MISNGDIKDKGHAASTSISNNNRLRDQIGHDWLDQSAIVISCTPQIGLIITPIT